MAFGAGRDSAPCSSLLWTSMFSSFGVLLPFFWGGAPIGLALHWLYNVTGGGRSGDRGRFNDAEDEAPSVLGCSPIGFFR
jgi:hypothetical protein